MHRSTIRNRTPFFSLLGVLSLGVLSMALPATGCIGKRRPDAEAERTASSAAPARAGLVQVSDVDDTLSHLVDEDRMRVPYDESDPYKGAAVPLVTIVEFSDFQCPYCGRLAEALDEVVATYPDDVRLVFKQYPLPMHADAEPGARAALAAHAQGKFWQMHDALFSNPREMSRDVLIGYARDLNLDMKRFAEDLDSGALRQKVAADMSLGNRVEVSSTPTFFVNGRPFKGAQSAEQIKRIVEEERSKAYALVDAGSAREEVYARIMRAAAGNAGEAEAEAAPTVDPDHRRGEPSKATNYAVPVGSDSPSTGPDDALVTVIEFGSYGCDRCKPLAKLVDAMRARHPDVRFVARQYPVEQDEAGALVALAADRQGKFWQMREELLASGPVQPNASVKLAQGLGLQASQFTRDLVDPGLRKQLDADIALARKFGGAAEAPYVFVNGRFLGPEATATDFEALLAEETKKAQAFASERQVPRSELFETMRKGWRGYEIAQQLEAPGGSEPGDVERVAMPTAGLPVKGDPKKAKVSIVECSDFDCGFCARVNPTLDQILENYGDEVAIYFRQFPLPMHPAAEPAHRAALAAHAQGKFWEMHDRLFADKTARGEDKLAAVAGELGLDVNAWRRDFDSPATKAKLEADMDACKNAGVTGTPAFFINGRSLVGAQPFEQFAAVIDEELRARR
jgi:protein-disulfide isomerase